MNFTVIALLIVLFLSAFVPSGKAGKATAKAIAKACGVKPARRKKQ